MRDLSSTEQGCLQSWRSAIGSQYSARVQSGCADPKLWSTEVRTVLLRTTMSMDGRHHYLASDPLCLFQSVLGWQHLEVETRTPLHAAQGT